MKLSTSYQHCFNKSLLKTLQLGLQESKKKTPESVFGALQSNVLLFRNDGLC